MARERGGGDPPPGHSGDPRRKKMGPKWTFLVEKARFLGFSGVIIRRFGGRFDAICGFFWPMLRAPGCCIPVFLDHALVAGSMLCNKVVHVQWGLAVPFGSKWSYLVENSTRLGFRPILRTSGFCIPVFLDHAFAYKKN